MAVRTGQHAALALVSVGFLLAEVLAVTPLAYLSWDEALYVSQFSTAVPAMEMDPHRSLGVPLLVAPVAAVTTEVTAIRLYLSALSAIGLYAAYRPWARYGPAWPAALLFASLSVTLGYGNAVLPNMPVALGAVASVGLFVTAADRGAGRTPGPDADPPRRRGICLALGGVCAGLALLRPTDAVWIAVALLGAAVVPRWRRHAATPAAAVLAGLSTGGVVWIAESLLRYGGPFRRLAMMREVTEAGTHFVAVTQLAEAARALAAPDPGLVSEILRWSALGLLLVVGGLGGLRAAGGTPARPAWTLAAATAAAVGAPYLILLSYPSERYLLPVLALLALPVGAGVGRALAYAAGARDAGPPRLARSRVAAAVVPAVLAAHVASQLWLARAAAEHSAAARAAAPAAAERLRALGVRPPCLVSGSFAPQIAYAARCASGDMAVEARRASVRVGSWRERHPETVGALTARDLRSARRDGERLVVVRTADRPAHLRTWQRSALLADRPWYAYFPP